MNRDQITLPPWPPRRRVVNRDSTDTVGFESVMLPLMWTTNIRFLRDGRDAVPLLFTPCFKQRFRQALEDRGCGFISSAVGIVASNANAY